MVEDAAKKAGYVGIVYHGTNADFTVFDKKQSASTLSLYQTLGSILAHIMQTHEDTLLILEQRALMF